MSKSCAIYFSGKVEDEEFIILFLEIYLKKIIENKIVNSISLFINNNSKFCLCLFKNLKKHLI